MSSSDACERMSAATSRLKTAGTTGPPPAPAVLAILERNSGGSQTSTRAADAANRDEAGEGEGAKLVGEENDASDYFEASQQCKHFFEAEIISTAEIPR